MEQRHTHNENTFIIVNKTTGCAECELSDENASRVNREKFDVLRPSEYLPTLNRAAKAEAL